MVRHLYIVLLGTLAYASALECGADLKGPNGTVTSPNWPKNYPNDALCFWNITVQEDNTIELEFLDFELEAADSISGCLDGDFVTVGDVDKTYGPYCGTEVRPKIISETNKLEVIFSSDKGINFRGFKASYKEILKTPEPTTTSTTPDQTTATTRSPLTNATIDVTPSTTTITLPTTRYPPNVNCGTEQIGNSGYISSPKFPGNYPNNADCAFFIELEPNTTGAIKLSFLAVEVESSENCTADSLKVHDGENGYAPVVANICGNESISPIITSGKAVYLHFVTDGANTARGFNISWERATCEEAGGVCAKICQYGEWEEQRGTCGNSTLKCCKPKPPPTTPTSRPSSLPTTNTTTTLPSTAPPTSTPPTTPPPPACGKRFIGNGDLTYIVNGNVANPNSWPWMLSLQKSYKHACGAVLLSDQWAVTSASCVDDGLPVTIVAGEHDRLIRSGDEVHVKKVNAITHEGFINTPPWPNNIALLKLSKKLKLGPKIFPACFPQTDDMEFLPGDNCYVTGWGETMRTSDPTMLNERAVSPILLSICSRYYTDLLDTNICAGPGICNRDGGGPLVCKRGDQWFLAGLASYGRVYCRGYPTVFTRVSKYKTWVDENVKANGGY